MIVLRFPSYLVDFLLLYGLFCLAIHIAKLVKALVYRIKNKTWETNLQEQKMFLLLEKNKALTEELSSLREENNELTKTIFKHLQG
tara:strand:- start:60 stop:317 length:258 start_codon:yes stop_codon:yes gene_type:complete